MQSKIFTSISIVLVVAVVFFSSCKKTVTVDFNKDFPNLDLVIDTTSHTGTFSISKNNVSTGLSQFASQNGFDINNIKSVKVKSCTITLNDTSTTFTHMTFDALDSAKVMLSGTGLSNLTVGTANPITHNGSTSLTLNTGSTDVTSYLKASSFNFTLVGANNQPITHKIPANASVTFTVTASLTK